MSTPNSQTTDLIPGLPDQFVLDNILPRLPWYTRPICRALSSSWRSSLDNSLLDDYLKHCTRNFQLPLLRDASLVCLGNEQQLLDILLVRNSSPDEQQDQVMKLPPVEKLPPGQAKVVAADGLIFLWTLAPEKCWSPSRDLIFRLDLGGGGWSWDWIRADRTSNWFDAIDFGGKIYSHWEYRSSPFSLRSPVKLDVVVYDMMTDACDTGLGKWDVSSVGVVSGDDKLYGFSEMAELMRFDAVSKQWKPQEEIPPPWGCQLSLKLLGGDCFEPAVKVGNNIVALDGDSIHWYNSAAKKTWVEIEKCCGAAAERVCVIRGVLYAIVRNVEGWQIVKGRIHVASKRVIWERIAEFPSPVISFTTL